MTDANVRSRATVQIFNFLNGTLPRIPKTAVEVYSKLVNQNVSVQKITLFSGFERMLSFFKTLFSGFEKMYTHYVLI